MQHDNITVILIRDGQGKTSTYNFSRRGLKFLAIFLLMVFIYVINLFLDYRSMKIERIDLIPSVKNLSMNNEILEKKKADKNIKIRILNEKVFALREFDDTLKDKFALNKFSDDQGMGGIEDESDDLILQINNAMEEYSEDVLKPTDDLEKEAQEQKESFQELIKFLGKQDSRLRSTPAIWPVRGFITSGFGYRISPFSGRLSFHKGLDISGRKGTPIRATADGIVIFAGWQEGYGKLVVIDHGYGYRTFYGHNSKIIVEKWQKVKRRDIIALLGSTGRSTGPHSHYEVLVNGKVENPYNFVLE